jgi:RNA polymerase sigma-70 factor, ECF subfamily
MIGGGSAPLPGPGAAGERDDDAHLVARLREGCMAALESLYERHAPSIFATAVRASGDRAIAAEVVQDTFLALWNRAELFDPSRGTLHGWLATIARNRAIDRFRRGRYNRALPFSTFGKDEDQDLTTAEWIAAAGRPVGMTTRDEGPEASVSAKERHAAITEAINSLDSVERSVIVLAYGEGLSQAEVALRLGWPIGTVKTRTRRALRRLRGILEDPPNNADPQRRQAMSTGS